MAFSLMTEIGTGGRRPRCEICGAKEYDVQKRNSLLQASRLGGGAMSIAARACGRSTGMPYGPSLQDKCPLSDTIDSNQISSALFAATFME
jgi:hypothetical protein